METLPKKERKSSFVLITLLFLFAFIGFADALYLSVSEFRGIVVTCGVGGCAEVTTSEYSSILGIPVAYLGLAHYSLMLLLTFFVFAFRKRSLIFFPILPLAIIGVTFSSWLVFAQLVLLKAICFYCMASALSSLLLFVVTALLVWRNRAHLKSGSVSAG